MREGILSGSFGKSLAALTPCQKVPIGRDHDRIDGRVGAAAGGGEDAAHVGEDVGGWGELVHFKKVPSQAAGLVFFPTATRARGVTSDFSGQADDVVGLGDFSDEAIVFLEHGNPLFIHEVLD